VSTSNFETRHNITATFNLKEQFFDGYDTNFGVFFRARSGLPYSLTFTGGAVFNDAASGNDNALIYVPTGPNDPNLSPSSNANAVNSLLDYLEASNCEFTPGQSIERNSCSNDWAYDLDLRFSQELPFIGKLTGLTDDRVTLFADFNNFLNLINEDWNVLRSRNSRVNVVRGGVDAQGRYIITNNNTARPNDFLPNDQNNLRIGPSAWRIQVGARYEF
jgi:hypothetical protein